MTRALAGVPLAHALPRPEELSPGPPPKERPEELRLRGARGATAPPARPAPRGGSRPAGRVLASVVPPLSPPAEPTAAAYAALDAAAARLGPQAIESAWGALSPEACAELGPRLEAARAMMDAARQLVGMRAEVTSAQRSQGVA